MIIEIVSKIQSKNKRKKTVWLLYVSQVKNTKEVHRELCNTKQELLGEVSIGSHLSI